MNSSRHRKITQNIFLLLCLMGIIVFAVLQNKVDLKNDVLSNISIKTTDESITITWNVPTKTNITKVLIEIKDNNERIIKEVNVLPTSKKYKYNDGELNNSYIVTVNSLYKDGTKIEVAYFKDNHYQNHYIITEENGKSQLYSDVKFPWLKLP